MGNRVTDRLDAGLSVGSPITGQLSVGTGFSLGYGIAFVGGLLVGLLMIILGSVGAAAGESVPWAALACGWLAGGGLLGLTALSGPARLSRFVGCLLALLVIDSAVILYSVAVGALQAIALPLVLVWTVIALLPGVRRALIHGPHEGS
jgi:hypothetical protein